MADFAETIATAYAVDGAALDLGRGVHDGAVAPAAVVQLPLRMVNRHGLIAGVHTDGPATAQRRFDEGFHFCTLLNDVRLLVDAAKRMVSELRGAAPAEASKTY